MDCKDFEPFIFTYAELNNEEKQSLDAHLQQCASCRALFAEVNQLHDAVKLAAIETPQPRHATQLTHRIMAKVQVPAEVPWLKQIEVFLQTRFVKYSLSTASFALLLIFFTEVFSDGVPGSRSFQQSQGEKVVLSAQRFREEFMKRKNDSPSDECRTPFRTMSYTMDCMKNKLKQ